MIREYLTEVGAIGGGITAALVCLVKLRWAKERDRLYQSTIGEKDEQIKTKVSEIGVVKAQLSQKEGEIKSLAEKVKTLEAGSPVRRHMQNQEAIHCLVEKINELENALKKKEKELIRIKTKSLKDSHAIELVQNDYLAAKKKINDLTQQMQHLESENVHLRTAIDILRKPETTREDVVRLMSDFYGDDALRAVRISACASATATTGAIAEAAHMNRQAEAACLKEAAAKQEHRHLKRELP